MKALRNSRLSWPFGLGFLMLCVAIAYANFFTNAFQFDDFHTVTDNPAIRSLGNIPRFFTDATTFSVLPANRTYRPLVSTSLAVDYAMGRGYVPFWFHLSTFLWFLVLLACLFVMYRRLFSWQEDSSATPWLALGAAAWFGLHPAMAETVNYVIQRGDLYCTLGCVAALTLFVVYPALRKTGLYLVPLAAALLSKPPAAVFPALLFFYVFFFETDTKQARWKQALLAAIPSAVVVAALMVLQSAMTPKSYAPSIVSPWAYRMTQPYVWLRYFGALFLPLHLNVDTDLAPFSSFNARELAGFLFLLLLAAAIAYTARRRSMYPIAYGLLWFVLTQLPTSLYTLSEVENDHRMFFSFIGLIPAVLWMGFLFYRRLCDRERFVPIIGVAALLALVAYSWGVHRRNIVWHTPESLWRDDVEKSPENGRGLMIYGVALMGRGDYADGQTYFERALLYTPYYPTLEINLGVVNGALQKDEEAERHFRRAIALAPASDEGHAFYGRWLMEQGRIEEAIGELKEAIALNSARPMQREMLLMSYSKAGDLANLHEAATETLKLIPDDRIAQSFALDTAQNGTQTQQTRLAPDTNVLIDQSLAFYQAGRFTECIAAAQAALKIDPRSAAAWNNIAAAHASMHAWDEAIAAAKRAIALDPDLQLAKNNLAWAMNEKQKTAARSSTQDRGN